MAAKKHNCWAKVIRQTMDGIGISFLLGMCLCLFVLLALIAGEVLNRCLFHFGMVYSSLTTNWEMMVSSTKEFFICLALGTIVGLIIWGLTFLYEWAHKNE